MVTAYTGKWGVEVVTSDRNRRMHFLLESRPSFKYTALIKGSTTSARRFVESVRILLVSDFKSDMKRGDDFLLLRDPS